MKRILTLLLVFAITLSCVVCSPLQKAEAAGNENLALDAKVIRASRWGWDGGIFLPSWLNDGDTKTIWASYYSAYTDIPSNEKFRHLVEFDLGEEKLIGSVVVTARPEIYEPAASANVEVHLSNDRNFKNYVVIGNTGPDGLGISESVTFQAPKGASYRYFRVVHTVHTVMILSEVEVYGASFDPNQLIEYNDVEDSDLINAVNVAQRLNIIKAAEGELGVNKLITRGEAAEWLANAARLSSGEEEVPYADIEESSYKDSIRALYLGGIASPSANYNPESFITYNEFATMLLRVLGYDEYIWAKGGYPAGVQRISRDIDLFDLIGNNVNFEECVSRADALKLIYQALVTPCYDVEGYKDGIAKYEKGEKLIHRVFGYDLVQGQVTANDTTGLYSTAEATSPSHIMIEKTSYRDEKNALWKYIGKRVVAIIDQNGTKERVVDAWVDDEATQVKTIYGENITKISGNTVTYVDEKDNEKRIKLKGGYSVLKNYVALPTFNSADIVNDRVHVEFVDADDDGVFDSMFIYDPIPILPVYCDVSEDSVHVGQSDDRTHSSNFNTATRIDVDEAAHIHIQQGKDYLLPAGIIEPQLLMVYKSDNNKVVRVDVFKNVVSGFVTATDNKGIYVDDEYFEFSYFYPTSYKNKIKIGDAVSFVTDEAGKIVRDAMVNEAESPEVLAFVVEDKTGESPKDDVVYRVYTQDKKMLELSLADKVNFTAANGTRSRLTARQVKATLFTGEEAAYSSSATNNGAFIKYKLNDEGKISTINCQTVSDTRSNRYYVPRTRAWTDARWGSDYLKLSKNDTPVFVIPFDSATNELLKDASYYTVTTVGSTFTIDYQKYYTELYRTSDETDEDKKSPYTDFVALWSGHNMGSSAISPVTEVSSSKLLVEGYKKVRNSDDTESYAIEGYDVSSGKKTTVTLHPDVNKIIEGNKLIWAKTRGDDGISSLYGDYNLLARAQANNIPSQYIVDVTSLKSGDIICYRVENGYASSIERILQCSEIEDAEENMGTATFYYQTGDNLNTMAANSKLLAGFVKSYNNQILSVEGNNKIILEYPSVNAAFTVEENGDITKETSSVVPGSWYVGDRIILFSSGVGNFSVINYK